MYNNQQIGAENGGKVPLASNQAVGGSNPSESTKKLINGFRRFYNLIFPIGL